MPELVRFNDIVRNLLVNTKIISNIPKYYV